MAEETRVNRRSVAFWVLVLLGVITVGMVVATLYWVFHTVQKDARLVGLPIPVQTVPAKVESMQRIIGASGTIEPSYPMVMTAKVVARVLKVPVDLGGIVRPGDLLAELDPQLYQASLAKAQADYDHAHKQLRRMRWLARRHFASAVEVELARAAEASAFDALVSAKINLSNTRILSPAPAVVQKRLVNPGEITKVDQDLFELGVLDPVMMDAAVSEDSLGYVYIGMAGEVGTDAFPGESFKGTIAKIDSVVSDATRTFGAYIQLTNHDLRLKKGVTGYARLQSTRMALTVPSTAIMNPVGDRPTVFVVGSDHKARIRKVRSGLTVGGMTEILSGLQLGEQVVTVGQFGLRDNDRVEVNRFAPWNKPQVDPLAGNNR
jgi:membrane fusion protein (multidrug efflux system)